MTIPLPVILDALSQYPVTTRIRHPDSLRFAWASFLPEAAQELRQDRLYLCTLEQARRAGERFEQNCFLCVSDRPAAAEDLPPNCILAEGVPSVVSLAELVQERICFIRDWSAQLNETAVENPSYQQLMDLSEPVLGNPIYILDASYKLLAYTRNILDDDEIDVRLRETGYHSEETLVALRNCNRFQAYQNDVGMLVNPPGNPNKYATVSKWLWDRGMPVVHLIMVCSNQAPDDSLLALFEIVAQNCAKRFRQQQSAAPHTGHYYDPLLNEILFGKLDNPRIIAERAKMSGLPLAGNFNCYKIILRDIHSFPIARVLDEFLSLFPDASAISHGYEIIALNQMNSATQDHNVRRIRPFLEKYDAVCGISEPFNVLTGLPVAYTQATRALGIGEHLLAYEPVWNTTAGVEGAANPPRDRSVFYYDDIFVYYALAAGRNGDFDVYRRTPYLDVVRGLIESDREHGANNAQILFAYLVSERRATQTGELLHMHRNNVLYHIPRIEKQIGLSLDDYWVRLKLLLAFHLTELEQAHEYTNAAALSGSGDHGCQPDCPDIR